MIAISKNHKKAYNLTPLSELIEKHYNSPAHFIESIRLVEGKSHADNKILDSFKEALSQCMEIAMLEIPIE